MPSGRIAIGLRFALERYRGDLAHTVMITAATSQPSQWRFLHAKPGHRRQGTCPFAVDVCKGKILTTSMTGSGSSQCSNIMTRGGTCSRRAGKLASPIQVRCYRNGRLGRGTQVGDRCATIAVASELQT